MSTGRAEADTTWPGYHTDLDRFELNGETVGIGGCAVGASLAVLVAGQLFAAGCQFLAGVPPSDQVVPRGEPPLQAAGPVRDTRRRSPQASLGGVLARLPSGLPGDDPDDGCPVPGDGDGHRTGPVRGRSRGRDEAAALYALASERDQLVVCFAHVTHELRRGDDESERGDADGTTAALKIVDAAVAAWNNDT
ncbi:hypothetical protein [Halorientalis sp.]|uniref:hypothetical protein n=1 Tax=Halorientalis sp. TaxID=1931229 RepID=UPI0026087F99|nr:hypothetical protein [Halorientalis sp.]